MSNFTSAEARERSTPHYIWESGYHINGRATPGYLEEIVLPSLNQLPEGSLVADFGSGDGRFARETRAKGSYYVVQGYELDPQAVERFNTEFAYTPHRAEVADITRLDLSITGVNRFDGALFWRVLHAINRENHQTTLRGIVQTLKPGASLHVAVRSDRDWVAAELKKQGLYRSGEMNECFPAMAEALKPQGISSWPLYFFRAGELVRLGERAGLAVVHQQPIQEPSGYEVLRKTSPPLSYDYVEFVKD